MHLGSVIALSDVNSVIVERYSYDVFGEPNTTSSLGNPYLFTARRYDIETALYYYRARYYDSYLGRFLQTDPIGYDDGLNLYTYVGNNPVVLIDPWGLTGEPEMLSREKFENRMEPTIRPILERSKLGGWRFRRYYYMADSDFDRDYKLYNYRGRIADGTEINYYIQGIIQEHYNIPPYNVIALPLLHNLFNYGHLPTWNEYFFTALGRLEYDYWVEKVKKETSKNTTVRD